MRIVLCLTSLSLCACIHRRGHAVGCGWAEAHEEGEGQGGTQRQAAGIRVILTHAPARNGKDEQTVDGEVTLRAVLGTML
jgi:hypothetical protein